MKESKIILFDSTSEFGGANEAIKSLENDGWEVVEHKLSSTSTDTCSYVYISVLFQREKV